MQWRVILECFSLKSFGYHINSKRDVFFDVTQQKYLRFSQMSFWDGTTYRQEKVHHYIATQWDMQELVSRYLTRFFDVLMFK